MILSKLAINVTVPVKAALVTDSVLVKSDLADQYFHKLLCRSLTFIEDYIRGQVLPHYGNTHTTTTVTSLQTTLYRHEAR